MGYGLRVIGYGELRIPVIENGKDDAASKSPRITQGKEKNRAEMRLPKFGRCMAAQRAVPESNSGAMNEAWTAEYRREQNTSCAYSPEQRRALNDYTNIRG